MVNIHVREENVCTKSAYYMYTMILLLFVLEGNHNAMSQQIQYNGYTVVEFHLVTNVLSVANSNKINFLDNVM